MRARIRAAWPHLRAGFVVFHLGVMWLLAFPAPVGGMDRRAWADPTVQAELSAWAPRFGMTLPVFEDRLYAFASGYMSVRDRALVPFQRYVEITGTDQPWRMFIAPHRFPAKFQVQSRKSGEPPDAWTTLFEERDAQHAWHASYFAQERVRSELFRMAWPEFAYDARRHCDYLAKLVFEEDASAAGVRCRFYKAASPSPEEVLSGNLPAGNWVNERVVVRPVTLQKRGTP